MALRCWLFLTLIFTVMSCAPSACLAQGLRISTHVYDLEKSGVAEQMVSSSLTLCHNGRVYDYVDAADEVVIFDPVDRRFIILNNTQLLSTTLTFDEIRHKMDSVEPITTKFIQELRTRRGPSSTRIADSIAFQLHPKFEQSYDAANETLVLSAPPMTYRVETREWKDVEQVQRYLAYADWTAQLNFILHPGSLLPGPRITLNDSLRDLKDRMPISVELDLRPGESLHLRAAHQLTHGLSDDDHARIAKWDNDLKSKGIRAVPFLSYQQAVLVSRVR